MTTPDYLQRDQDAAEDRAAASAKWFRGYVQLRGVLVQNPEPVSDRSGPLADFVKERQHRALLLYMMRSLRAIQPVKTGIACDATAPRTRTITAFDAA